jgi:hypothetical protein
MRLWLDDKRPGPRGWVHVTTAQDALRLLATGQVEYASFDHDLAGDASGTDLVRAMIRDNAWPTFKPNVHSGNPFGARRMRFLIENYGPYRMRRAVIAVGSVPIQVEVANNDIDRARGLANRKSLATDSGMLFVFDVVKQQRFTMKDTFLPLDMIFVNANRIVVGVVQSARPNTPGPYSVRSPAKFVIEVNAGFTDHYGIGIGTPVHLETVLR